VVKARRIRWAEHATHMREMTNVYLFLVRKSEEKEMLQKPRRLWEAIVNIYLKETQYQGADWIGFMWLKIGYSNRFL
jgi:hypothetical protein